MLLKQIKEIIERYLSGTHNALEQRAIDSWLDKLQNTAPSRRIENPDHIRDDMWRHIKTSQSPKAPRTLLRMRFLWQAATAAAILLIGSFIFSVIDHQSDVFYHTGAGETREIMMADGSCITLSENTRLSVSRHFNTDTIRQVDLFDGEVFFDVKKDPKRPFIIKNKLMHTEVLGTSFTIRTFEALGKWHIGVKTGKVRVSQMDKQGRPYILLADDSLFYDRERDVINYIQAPTTTGGNLVFEDENLANVVQKLARHYNRIIQVAEESSQIHQFSGEFEGDEPFIAVLDIICVATNMQYHLQGDTVVLSKKK